MVCYQRDVQAEPLGACAQTLSLLLRAEGSAPQHRAEEANVTQRPACTACH